MHLSEYLAFVCPENVYVSQLYYSLLFSNCFSGEDSKWLEECKSQLEPKIKQALSQW